MNDDDRQAIERLFSRLSDVERQHPGRDREAEELIARQVAGQPAAPYYLAQTVVVQEHALEQAQGRIDELERALRNRPASGGFLSGLFGGGQAQQRPAAGPNPGRNVPRDAGARQGFQSGSGSGFLAGAAQTAMGVAGGVLLGNAIMGMFGDEAEAAPGPDEQAPADEEAQGEGSFFDDFGDDEI